MDSRPAIFVNEAGEPVTVVISSPREEAPLAAPPLQENLQTTIATLATVMQQVAGTLERISNASGSSSATSPPLTTSSPLAAQMAAPAATSAPPPTAVPARVTSSAWERAVSHLERPFFDGKQRSNPARFLEELDEYIERLRVPDEHQIGVAVQCLREDALYWGRVSRERWTNYAEFREAFVQMYWSEEVQCHARRKISQATWDRRKGSMLGHLTYHLDLANALIPRVPERTLIRELVGHFPEAIRHTWLASRYATVPELIKFVRDVEHISDAAQIPKRDAAVAAAIPGEVPPAPVPYERWRGPPRHNTWRADFHRGRRPEHNNNSTTDLTGDSTEGDNTVNSTARSNKLLPT